VQPKKSFEETDSTIEADNLQKNKQIYYFCVTTYHFYLYSRRLRYSWE